MDRTNPFIDWAIDTVTDAKLAGVCVHCGESLLSHKNDCPLKPVWQWTFTSQYDMIDIFYSAAWVSSLCLISMNLTGAPLDGFMPPWAHVVSFMILSGCIWWTWKHPEAFTTKGDNS